MDAPKIQISQLLSETTKDCDNIVITVLCLSVIKKIPSQIYSLANHSASISRIISNNGINFEKSNAANFSSPERIFSANCILGKA